MTKEELIKRLDTLDTMAAQIAEECLPHESCEVFVTPLAVMYRMRDRIRNLEQDRINEFIDLKNENVTLRFRVKHIESIIPECLAMAEAWEDSDGDHDTDLIKRLRAIHANAEASNPTPKKDTL